MYRIYNKIDNEWLSNFDFGFNKIIIKAKFFSCIRIDSPIKC